MPANGAQQRAQSDGCSYAHVLPQAGDKSVLVHADETGRIWTLSRTIYCTAERHDTVSAYKNLGCRCPKATERTVDYDRRRRNGRIAPNQPATMTRRRLQALAVIGWTSENVGARIGRHHVSISQIRRGEHDVVTGATARAVLRVYRQLHNQPGPSTRSRAYASRQDWTGPSPVLMFLDIDEVAVARVRRGEADATSLHRGERLAAVHAMHTDQLTYSQIAGRLRLSQRQVYRDLADLGLITSTGSATGVPSPSPVSSPDHIEDSCAPEKTSSLSCDRARNDEVEETS